MSLKTRLFASALSLAKKKRKPIRSGRDIARDREFIEQIDQDAREELSHKILLGLLGGTAVGGLVYEILHQARKKRE